MPDDPSEQDLERQGLLEGTETDEERSARLDLLRQLLEQGASIEELRRAVVEDRLALVPAQRALAGEPRYTVGDLAQRAGLDEQLLLAVRAGLGLSRQVDDGPIADDQALEAARHIHDFLELGIAEADLLEVVRVVGRAAENVAAALRGLVGSQLLQAGDNERDLGMRYAAAVEQLLPLAGPLHEVVVRLHLLEQITQVAVGQAERAAGRLDDASPTSVAFADLVGFTKLGERLDALELGRVAGRLEELAAEVAEPPVRLVKAVGDGVLFTSPRTGALLKALFGLLEAVEAEGEDFPGLTVGVARGPVAARAGDVYGATVNLASRVGTAARPGAVLCTREVRDDCEEGYEFSRTRPRRLRGVARPVPLYRVRPAGESER